MQEEKTLLVLAGGIGNRFGGLKQIEPIDDDGNFIVDYSIFDAIRIGFNKVIFVIKKENYDIFKETIGKRIEKQIKVEYAFQGLNDYLPKGFDTGDLIIILLLLLMAGDCEEDKNNAILTIALYFLM